MEEANTIQEIFPGHFQVILDYPTAMDLTKILDMSYKFVWVTQHNEGRTTWMPYTHTLYGREVATSDVVVRNVMMEYLMETTSFIELLSDIRQTIRIVQTNLQPPHYLDLGRLKGKQKYELLKSKLDYRLEVEIPGAADYAPLISSDRAFLEDVLNRLA